MLSAHAAGAIYAIPVLIDGTGTTDVTSQLQSFLNGVPDGSTIELPAGGRYRVEGTLTLQDRHDLTIEGNGSETFATTTGDRNRANWLIRNGSNIIIRDLIVKGANPNAGTGSSAYVAALEAQHGFVLAGPSHVELDHVSVTDVYGDFVYIGLGRARSSDVWIHDSTFTRNGRQGISVTAGRDVRITDNNISDVRRTVFDIEPNGLSWGADGILIQGNTIGPARLNFISSLGVGPVDNVTVADNQLRGRTLGTNVRAPKGTIRSHFTITNNVSDKNAGSPSEAVLSFTNVRDVTVTGNTQPMEPQRSMSLVAATNACNVEVRNNVLPGAIGQLQQSVPACA